MVTFLFYRVTSVFFIAAYTERGQDLRVFLTLPF